MYVYYAKNGYINLRKERYKMFDIVSIQNKIFQIQKAALFTTKSNVRAHNSHLNINVCTIHNLMRAIKIALLL